MGKQTDTFSKMMIFRYFQFATCVMGIMNIPNHVEIDEMEELQMLEQAVIALAAEKLGWQDDLARARISVQMTQELMLYCLSKKDEKELRNCMDKIDKGADSFLSLW